MATVPVTLQGITQEDIQRLIQNTVNSSGKIGSGIVAFDVSYLYNFHKSDVPYVSKLNKIPRYNPLEVIEWHRMLERWHGDQTVNDSFGRQIEPIQIVRQFDKIVNEGLEGLAMCLVGQSSRTYKYHALGEGDVEEALAGDTQLVDELSRIDVTQSSLGGSLSRDGSTVYIVGNHPITMPSADITETGVFDHINKALDHMLDHTVFPVAVQHDQNEDAQGSTTIVYMCGV